MLWVRYASSATFVGKCMTKLTRDKFNSALFLYLKEKENDNEKIISM
jgi:hypothetical protein